MTIQETKTLDVCTQISCSLKSRLVSRLVKLQAVLLAATVLLVTLTHWFMKPPQRDEERVINALQEAIVRDAAGGLVVDRGRGPAGIRIARPST
jgi:hypothetical protein